MDHNAFSDYGSWSSTRSSWNSLESWPPTRSQLLGTELQTNQSADLLDLMGKRGTLQDMMEEFKLNGYDAPYTPEDDRMSSRSGDFIGMGPSSVYLRQKSWPEPEATPIQRLPRPKSEWISPPTAPEISPIGKFYDDDVIGAGLPSISLRQKSWPVTEATPAQRLPRPKSEWIPSTTALDFTPAKKTCDDMDPPTPVQQLDTISAEQVRVLNSLPNAVLYGLLRDLEQTRNDSVRTKRVPDPKTDYQECRFCKNNGERESYYRAHVLKDQGGRVRCPVLRKFVCKRCGASGDRAHTLKYCPLSTDEERIKSSAMMRSVRLASGRRRGLMAEPSGDYVMFGDTSPSFLRDYRFSAPLSPPWADLEQKLNL